MILFDTIEASYARQAKLLREAKGEEPSTLPLDLSLIQKLENRGFESSQIMNAIYILHRAKLPTNDEQLLLNELNNGESCQGSGTKDCNICMNNEVNCAVLPCRHATMCINCAEQVKNFNGKCPFCNTVIESVMQLYM